MSSGSDKKGVLRLSALQGGKRLLADQQQRSLELERNVADLKALEQQQQAASKTKSGKSRHVAHAQGWKAICTEPDYCKVGKDIVAFNSFATLDTKHQASRNVRVKGTSIYRTGDVIKKVEADAGKHIVSGTSLADGYVRVLEGHRSVKANGLQVARHDSRCLINCDANGLGGAQGKLVTTEKNKSIQAADDSIGREADSTKLNLLKSLRSKLRSAQVDFDEIDKYIDFQAARKAATALIDSMHVVPGVPPEKLQMMRGVLGATKDFVLGTGESAYEAMKSLPKLAQRSLTSNGRMLNVIDAQICAENIRLGKFSIASVGNFMRDVGSALVQPVTDPWKKGHYIEAITRAGAEAGAFALGSFKAGKSISVLKLETSAVVTDGVHVTKSAKPTFSGDWQKYRTHGIKDDPIESAEGQRLVSELESRGLNRTEAIREATNLMKTGATLPMANPVEVGDRFFKVLDDAAEVGPASPYWMTERQLAELKGLSYDQIADKLGIPLASQQGKTFKVVEIAAFRPSTSFTSVIAPTTEIGANGAVWAQKGGGAQTLLTNRDAFTAPKLTSTKLP